MSRPFRVLAAATGVIACAGTLAAQGAPANATTLGAHVVSARVELVHALAPDAQLKNGWRSLYATAISDAGHVAVSTLTQPGSLLSVFGADGSLLWSKKFPTATVTSLSFAGDTLAHVEQEDESELVLLALSTGKEVKRYALPKQTFESANLLGRYNDRWYVQLRRSAGEYSAESLPYRMLRSLDPATGRWEDLYLHVDSTPRVIADRLVAIPTPFAPAPTFALSQRHGPLLSSGTNWDIDAVGESAALQPRFRLLPLSTQLDDTTYNRIAAEWIASPPVRFVVPEGTHEKAAELGRSTHGRTLASLMAAADGALLVRRRDTDSSASSARISTVWDLIDAQSDTVARLRLEADARIAAFASNRRLLVVQQATDGPRTLHVARIVRVEGTP
jgi:hypothetical protein